MGLVHTTIRSKLGVEKVRKTTMVGMDIKQTHSEAGLLRARGKRNFTSQASEPEPDYEPEMASDHLSMGDNDDLLDFDQLSEHLIKSAAAANSDQDIGDVEDDDFECAPTLAPPLYTIRILPLNSSMLSNQATQATKTSIPFRILFKYPTDKAPPSEGMNSFWKGGNTELGERDGGL